MVERVLRASCEHISSRGRGLITRGKNLTVVTLMPRGIYLGNLLSLRAGNCADYTVARIEPSEPIDRIFSRPLSTLHARRRLPLPITTSTLPGHWPPTTTTTTTKKKKTRLDSRNLSKKVERTKKQEYGGTTCS